MRSPSTATLGQAAVETALTLPLVIFLVLGTLQLFILLQAKVMTQYAVYQAARIGSVSNGRCDMMLHATLLSLTPTIRSFMGPSLGGTPSQRLAATFGSLRTNDYAGAKGWGTDEAVVWLIRESPRFPRDNLTAAREHFDNPLDRNEQPVRLELRMIFWAPLAIPFADWVFSRMMLAHYGLRSYTAQNPLMITQKAGWQGTGNFRPDSEIAGEYLRRVTLHHFVFPIEVSYTMRMMSPVRAADFGSPNCPGAPNTL